MNTYQITVVEPRAIKLLKSMEEENLIQIRPTNSVQKFRDLLKDLRSIPNPPSLDEITDEVEQVRKDRFERQNKK